MSAHFKSGGTDYVAEDNSLRVALHLNSTTTTISGIGVPCRAASKISDELKPFCASFIHPDRPELYLVHRDGVLYYEPEYAPTNPDTLDEDTSFIAKVDKFFPGFTASVSLRLPNHYVVAGPGGAHLRLAKFQDTPEFKDAASYQLTEYHTKGETTKCMCGMYTLCPIDKKPPNFGQ